MVFEKTEYIERLKKTKISMQEKGIDLLISQDTANINYLTGYDAWSFYYAQCALSLSRSILPLPHHQGPELM